MSGQNRDEKTIFMAALRLKSTTEREAYLREACGDDRRMRERVKALLGANDIKDDFLEAPAYDFDVTLDTAPMIEGPGTVIGPYKLLEKIGEGGMAVVYMAEQKQHIRRKVALKIIKLGMDTESVIARFEAERQALAMMDHPNIAKVLDAGTTEMGRPYFVMELVRGVSISDYCDANKLNTRERLDLFIQVCNAVHHAHQKGIIHRDIKPSNVMVTLHDDIAVPKVIDFGIAKATSQRLTEKTLFTRYAQMIGTPEYMSPEQAQFSGLDIDTRTDIYSLGVLLYELLTGTTPFCAKKLHEAGYGEMQRIIQEAEPPRPSTRLSTMGKTLTGVAEHRNSSPDLLTRIIRGDLDWIVMKALEKNRTCRYETVNSLAADIQRHINDEPVEAGPPSAIYRTKKFLRRHQRQAIGTAVAAAFLAVMATILAMYVGAVNRAQEAEFLEHKDIMSKAMGLRSKGQLQDALAKVETIVRSEYIGPEARLLHAQLVLKLAEGDPEASPTHDHSEVLGELESLLTERDEIAGQAHFHLAKIYYDSDPGVPGSTEEYISKWQYHRQEAERLLPQTADAYLLQALSTGTVPIALDYLNKALEIDARHYDSLRERAYLSYANGDYYKMAKDAARMVGIQPENPLGYSLSAIAQRGLGQFDAAIEDHNGAIDLSPPDAELCDQRRQTHMQIGNYEQALLDARRCAALQPEKTVYHFHAFCALVATGRYDDAQTEYETVLKSEPEAKKEFRNWSQQYVSDTLDAGLLWHPPESRPEGIPFLAMHEADDECRRFAGKATRAVSEGIMPRWSADGTKLVYGRGFTGSSAIAVLDLESGKSRLLVTPGKDPAWSPDGRHIAYVRDRRVLPFSYLTGERKSARHLSQQEEVWLVKADGTEEPRFLAKGGWPCWSQDSNRVFYHCRTDKELRTISIETGSEPVSIISCLGSWPVVSPDEKYALYRWPGGLAIAELSSKSIVMNLIPNLVYAPFPNWSPDGTQVILPDSNQSLGLFLHDVEEDKTTALLRGAIRWCSCSRPETGRIAFTRQLGWGGNSDIWVADFESLGPGRTLEEHWQEMVEFYSRRIETDPGDAENYTSRARFYGDLRETEKALADLEQFGKIVNNPSLTASKCHDVAWRLIYRAEVTVNPEIAVALFGWVNEIVPENWWYLWCLGMAHCRTGQWERAIAVLTRANELPDGRDALNFFFLSMAHWQLGEKAAAVDCYNKAIEWIHSTRDLDAALSRYVRRFGLNGLQVYNGEAAEVIEVKQKEFFRDAPLVGRRISPVGARTDSNHPPDTMARLINGAGLADADRDGLLEHDEDPENMWLSGEGQASGWIEFDLGDVHELESILVWNYNQRGHTDRGIKSTDISVWTQDAGWQKVHDDFEFAEAEGSFDYDEPTLVTFSPVKAQRVRFDNLSSFGDSGYVGLSEVRFFEKPDPDAVEPRYSHYTDRDTPMEAKLDWTPNDGRIAPAALQSASNLWALENPLPEQD